MHGFKYRNLTNWLQSFIRPQGQKLLGYILIFYFRVMHMVYKNMWVYKMTLNRSGLAHSLICSIMHGFYMLVLLVINNHKWLHLKSYTISLMHVLDMWYHVFINNLKPPTSAYAWYCNWRYSIISWLAKSWIISYK